MKTQLIFGALNATACRAMRHQAPSQKMQVLAFAWATIEANARGEEHSGDLEVALAITGCQQAMRLARRYESYHRYRATSDR